MLHEHGGPGRPLPDLRGLAEFVSVARLEHVSRAAEQLGVPQPTLSRRIARLEAAVGTPLLARRGRGVVLTRAGRALADAAERSLAELGDALAQLSADRDAETGTVTLAFLHTLGPAAVPRLVSEYGRSHPHVRFRLTQDGHEAVVGRLLRGEADLCLNAPLPDAEAVESVALQHQRLRLAVPRSHPLASRRRVRLAEVAGESFVGFKPGYGMRRIVEDWCLSAGFRPRLAFEGEDIATVRGLVAAGLGVALLPPAPRPTPEDPVEVDVHSPSAGRTIGAAWLSRPPLTPAAAGFRDFLLERGPGLLV